MGKAKWQCASCGGRNDEERVRCRICMAPRPESLRPMPPLRPTAPPAPSAAPPAAPPTSPPLPPRPAVDGAPARVASSSPPSSGPNRATLAIGAAVIVVVVAVLGFVVATSSGGASSSALRPDETVGTLLPETTARPGPDVPTENKMAVAMLPTVADLGNPWAQTELRAGADAFELGPNPSSADCVTPTPAVPEAGGRVSIANHVQGGEVTAQVKIFADPTAASADFNTPEVTQDLSDCVRRAIAEELGRAGIADVASVDVSLDDLDPPGIGEESAAQRFTISVNVAGRRFSDSVRIIRFRTGRTVGVLSCGGGNGISTDALFAQVQDLFTSRFQPL